MSTYQDAFITDSEAHTKPMRCSTLRNGGYVLLKGKRPCKIMDIFISKPGKHGSAKAHIVGIDVFNGKRYEEIHTSHSMVDVPDVKRSEHEISLVSHEGFINIFNDDMTIRGDIKWTEACQTPLNDIRAWMDEAEADTSFKTRVEAVMTSAMGHDVIKEVKMKKDN